MNEDNQELLIPLFALQNAFYKFDKYWESFSHYFWVDEIEQIPNLEYKLMKMNILLNNMWLIREVFPDLSNSTFNTYIFYAEALVDKAESHFFDSRTTLIELRNEYDDYLKAVEGLYEIISRTIEAIEMDQ